MHRARSVVLTNDELVEVRAAQRTFEGKRVYRYRCQMLTLCQGAYIRTALSQFSFALVGILPEPRTQLYEPSERIHSRSGEDLRSMVPDEG